MTARAQRATSLEWLDVLPADWEERDIGREVWVRARLGWRGLTASEYVDDGVPMLATPNISAARIDYLGANKITQERFDESPEIMLNEGDVLLSKDGTIGTVNVVRDLPGPATVNGSIAVLTPRGALDGRFLYWFIASKYAQAIFERLRAGMGVPHLFQRDINRIKVPTPPLAEQLAIAEYLDRETAQIDTLIGKQKALIETLGERRGAALDWLVASVGASPVPLRYRSEAVTVGIVVQPAQWYVHEGVPALRGTNVKPERLDLRDLVYLSDEGHQQHSKSRLSTGDVVVVRTGQSGSAATIPAKLDGVNAIDLLIVRPGPGLNGEYLAMLLNAPAIRERSTQEVVGTIQGHLNVSSLRGLCLPVPSMAEQVALVREWRALASKIDALIAKAERFIELATERRAALITAAVSGQLDVRGAA